MTNIKDFMKIKRILDTLWKQHEYYRLYENQTDII